MLTWMNSDAEGLLMVNSESSTTDGAQEFSTYILGQIGLQGGGGLPDYSNFTITTDYDNPVIKYLLDGPFGKVENPETITWNVGGTNGYILTESIANLGDAAVPIFSMIGTSGVTQGQSVCPLMIDPSRNLVVKTDSEMFDPAWAVAPPAINYYKNIFRKNFLAFCVNTAMYGSLFTDQFWDAPGKIKTIPQPQPESQP
jgi:hypothetical protein